MKAVRGEMEKEYIAQVERVSSERKNAELARIEAQQAKPMSRRMAPQVKGYDPTRVIEKYTGNERNASTIDHNIRMANPNFRRPLEK